MSDHLTDEQAEHAHTAMFGRNAPTVHPARWYLERLREAGWTVEPPPEPRYRARLVGDGPQWGVSTGDNVSVAYFFGADAKRFAREHADRLNAEHGGQP